MMYKPAPETIAALNREAESLDTTTDAVAAIRAVAHKHGMTCLRDGDQCVLYRLPDGTHVNAWIDAPRQGIRDGGQGFDDQVEWAEDQEPSP